MTFDDRPVPEAMCVIQRGVLASSIERSPRSPVTDTNKRRTELSQEDDRAHLSQWSGQQANAATGMTNGPLHPILSEVDAQGIDRDDLLSRRLHDTPFTRHSREDRPQRRPRDKGSPP
jgi:hypothetical protein